jgi:hypothetical protein
MSKKLVYVLLAVLVITSCKSGRNHSAETDFEVPDSIMSEGLEISEETMQNIVQNISSPVEMAALIKELGVPYSNKYLSSTARVEELSTTFKQSLNLGVYGADLGYLNMYNKTSAVIDYISAIKTLADGIKVGQFFDFTTLKRLATNNQNLDSLMYISVHSFNQMDKYLHSNNRSNLSALIVTGVWIEGLYLGTQVAKETTNDQLAERIGEQKLTLNELILILEVYKKDKQYAKLIDDLQLIKDQYQNVNIKTIKGEPEMIEENGVLTIIQNDKSVVEISPEQLNKIINTAEEVRNRIISL